MFDLVRAAAKTGYLSGVETEREDILDLLRDRLRAADSCRVRDELRTIIELIESRA
jgi:hypothetical protein